MTLPGAFVGVLRWRTRRRVIRRPIATGDTRRASRARTLLIVGVGVALAMLLLVLHQWIGRGHLVARSQTPELAGDFYDAITGYLKQVRWSVLGVALAAALTACSFW